MHFTPAPVRIREIGRKADGKSFLTFDSTEGVKYNVEMSSNLQTWSQVGWITATGSDATYTHSFPATDSRFFRVEEP